MIDQPFKIKIFYFAFAIYRILESWNVIQIHRLKIPYPNNIDSSQDSDTNNYKSNLKMLQFEKSWNIDFNEHSIWIEECNPSLFKYSNQILSNSYYRKFL